MSERRAKRKYLKWGYVIFGVAELGIFAIMAYFATTLFRAAESGQDFTSILQNNGLIVALCVGAVMGAISLKLTVTNSILLLMHLFEE